MRQLSNLMDKKGKTLDGEKRYQVIESDERYFIIDESTVGMEKKVTPNLIEGEGGGPQKLDSGISSEEPFRKGADHVQETYPVPPRI